MGILATVAVFSVSAAAVLNPAAEATPGSLVSFEQAAHTVTVSQYYQYVNVEVAQVDGRPIFDSITVGDAVAITTHKVFSDTVTVTDAIDSIDETELAADSITATDVLAIQFDAVRDFTDTATATDAAVLTVGLNDSDSVTVTDAITLEITNPLLAGSKINDRALNG